MAILRKLAKFIYRMKSEKIQEFILVIIFYDFPSKMKILTFLGIKPTLE